MEFNPNVPSTAQTPDTYLYISTAPSQTGTPEPKDLFVVATGILSGSAITGAPYNLTAGTSAPNDIVQFSDLNVVNQTFHRKSPVANRFRSAIQEVPIGINIFLASIKEPTNSGFAGFATKLLTVAGTASGSGEISVELCGHLARAPVATGDKASTIAASIDSAIDTLLLDAPMVTGAVIDIGLPVITITVNATGTSNFVIIANGITKTQALTAAWTPTQSATAIAAAIAADTAFPLTATSALGVVSLTWRTGFPVGTLSISTTDATQLFALSYLTTGSASGATVPMIYVVRGSEGNDSPIVISIPLEITGITLSPASINIATNAAGASGGASLFTLQVGTLSVVTSIPAASTPTQSGALIETAVNSATFPVTADAQASALTLFARNNWTINRIQISSTEDVGGQSYTLFDRHDSAGAITTVATVPGTPSLTALGGSGAPVLTTLLDNKAKIGQFIEWSVDYTDLTSINAITAHIELYANGYYQKNQRTMYCYTGKVTDAAALLTGATPQLGNYWRHSIETYQDSPCQGGAYSVQTAARLAATDLPYNQDGLILQSGPIAPMLPARSDTELSPTTIDVALGSYHLTVIQGVNGLVTIVRGKTTWGQSNTEWGDWSYGRMFDAYRFGMRAFLNNRFKGKVLFVGGGQIRTPRAFTIQDVKDAMAEYNASQDGIIVDGAKSIRPFIEAEPDPNDSSFIRLSAGLRVPRESHIRSGVITAKR